jgi:hypothetical protein
MRTEIPAEAPLVALLWGWLPEQGATMVAVESSKAISRYELGKAAAEGAKRPPPATGPHKKAIKVNH